MRLAIAFNADGGGYDADSAEIVRAAIGDDALGVYAVNDEQLRWPYGPAYLAWVAVAGWVSSLTGWEYTALVKVLPVLADAGLAVVAAAIAGRRGGRPAAASAAFVVIAAPPLVAVSAWHGQFDAVAVLPALGAVAMWAQRDRPGRAWAAGLLIGLGAALKTVPGVLVLALLPTGDRRSNLRLILGAAAVPLYVAAPWLTADFERTVDHLRYRGLPGAGGLSLLAQPSLARGWLHTLDLTPTALTTAVVDAAPFILATTLGMVGVVLVRARTPAPRAAVIVWLAVYVAGVSFFFQYSVWIIPFLAAAGWRRAAARASAALVVPMVITYGPRPWPTDAVVLPYVVVMDALWLACLVALVVLVRREWWVATGREGPVPSAPAPSAPAVPDRAVSKPEVSTPGATRGR